MNAVPGANAAVPRGGAEGGTVPPRASVTGRRIVCSAANRLLGDGHAADGRADMKGPPPLPRSPPRAKVPLPLGRDGDYSPAKAAHKRTGRASA